MARGGLLRTAATDRIFWGSLPDTSPAATACSRAPLRPGPCRTLTPVLPAWRDGRERPEAVAFGAEEFARFGGESPKPSRTSLRRTIAASSQSSSASLRADWCPPRRPSLTAFPLARWDWRPPCAGKNVAMLFSSRKGDTAIVPGDRTRSPVVRRGHIAANPKRG